MLWYALICTRSRLWLLSVYLRCFSESRSSSGSTPSVRLSVFTNGRLLGTLKYWNFSNYSHIGDLHLLFCVHFINIFTFSTGVELRHFFPSKMCRGCLVYVISNSNSFYLFIFKLCIMSVHTLKIWTAYLVYIIRLFFSFLGV